MIKIIIIHSSIIVLFIELVQCVDNTGVVGTAPVSGLEITQPLQHHYDLKLFTRGTEG